VHVIGKDITRFHAIYWPAFLMSARVALLAKSSSMVFCSTAARKMSKSVGNVIDPLRSPDIMALISCVIFCCVKSVWPGWHLFATKLLSIGSMPILPMIWQSRAALLVDAGQEL